MTVQIPALATPVPQSTDPVNFAARADAFLASLEPFAAAANLQNVENNQLNVSTVQAAGVAQSASAAAMAALGAPRFDPTVNYLAGNQVWSPVDAKIYRRLVAGRSAVDPSADPANWKVHIQTKADLGLGNVDNTSDVNKPVSIAQKAALDAKETPAGALAQLQAYGVGASAAPYIPNLETHRTGGKFTADAAVSAAAGLPLPLQHTIDYSPGVNSQTGALLATGLTGNVVNGGRMWLKKLNGGVWQAPKEFAFLDSPVFTGSPSAPNIRIGNTPSSDVNTIDAFEKKGLFTPILRGTGVAGGFTYTQQIGRYLRLADRYLWSARLQISATDGAGTGNLQLAGFPFIALNNSAAGAGVTFGFFAGLAVGSTIQSLSAIHVQNTSFVQIYKNTGSANPLQSLNVSDISGAFQLYAFGVCELP